MKTKFDVVYEDTPKIIASRIVAGLTQAAITQSSVSSATYRVDRYASRDDAENCTDGTEITDDTALTVSSVVYNTLQTGGIWADVDSTGYNFAYTVPASNFATSGYWYRVEVWITPSSGDAYLGGVWILECVATAKS